MLCRWVDDECQIQLKNLKQKCLDEWGIVVSLSTVSRALKEFHYTVKRVSLIPEKRNTPEVIDKRYDYAVQFNGILPYHEKIFFLDEMGIQIWMRSSRGSSIKGTRANKKVKLVKGKNYSIAVCMNRESLYFYEMQNMPYNGEHFDIFLQQLIEHFRVNGIDGAYLIMDNVPFHKRDDIVELIQNYGHTPIFLPPYSPFLNPIENLFNHWKLMIKQMEAQNEDQLYQYVDTAHEKITPQECDAMFSNMQKYIAMSLRREVIYN
jgi:transposase